MASKMSTESSNSRFMADAGVLERYLELTKMCMERVQSMTSVPSGSIESPKFNSEQCEYLTGKLRLAVESAHFFLVLLDRGNVWFPSAEALANCLESFKLLYTLSGEVESFTRECCRDEWIHAALMLTNVSEHVSSMGFNLQLWSMFVSFESEKSLTEVDSVYNSEVEIVKEKASRDKETLLANLEAVLRSTKRSSSEHQLAAFVRDRLDSSLNPAGESAGSSQASFSEAVLWCLKQKKLQVLGKGISATVYRMTWSGVEFAVKSYFGKDNDDFNKEVLVLRNLFHPNIVSVLGYAKENRKCSIVMEKMDDDLHSFMQARVEENRPPFGILEGIDVMHQIGRGMHYLHGLRIAHRDLKSSNILVRNVEAKELEVEYVIVKVSDFGLSKSDLENMTYTPQTFNTGTQRWMAPELIKFADAENTAEGSEGETSVKKYFPFKCDIYSFAIVCYEILTGEHPFAEVESTKEIKKLVLGGYRPPLPAGCPKKLKHLIERCWSSDAEARPNFGEICAELRHLKYLLTSSVVTADNSLLASSSSASYKSGFQFSYPTEAQMALKMSTESCNSRFTGDAGVLERYLELAKMCMERVQSMTSAPSGSIESPKFNSEQCEYLAGKLRLAVESAHFFLVLLSRGNVWFPSAEAWAKCLESFKLLYTLSAEVESFTRECCSEEWIHAALMLTNVSEHVSSMGFNLQLWSMFVSFESEKSLTEVDSVYNSEVEIVKEKASRDKETLSANLEAVLRSTKRRSLERQLAAFVRDRLDSSLNPAGESAGSSQASFSEAVLLSMKKAKKLRKLGKGASAIVYGVTWSGVEYAVKTFFGKENDDFKKEVLVIRNLFHPNIVSVLGYAKENGKCSIVMEKMDDDLHSFMQARVEENRPPFGILEGIDVMLQIGRGMLYLHGLRIAHRDLKSSNILVRNVEAKELEVEYVIVKVSDFGVSKRVLKSMTYTPQTFNTGTSLWMAPELIKFVDAENTTEVSEGETVVKKFPLKCDIYSFAIVCYEILTGEHPFPDVGLREVKRLVLMGKRPPLPAGCPNKLKHLIERCWSSDAEARPNFGEICAELRHLKYLLTSSVVTVEDSLLASSSFASFRCGLQLSHPTEVKQGAAQNPSRFHYLDQTKPAKARNVSRLGLPTVSAAPGVVANGDYSCVDYLEESISSIDVLWKLSKDLKVQLNIRQCEYLADKLSDIGRVLRAESDFLIMIHDRTDIRRKALLQLHYAVKRAEKLVRACCCDKESVLEAAVTLWHVKEDIKDILLDLQWWRSMIDIAIASVTWRSSGQRILLELLTCAAVDCEKLQASPHTSNNGLDIAAVEDMDALLRKVREVESLFAGGKRTAEQKHEYLLAVHVRSQLENSEVETMDELNEYDDANWIGFGGFGAVQNVRWMGRRCALKLLIHTHKKESMVNQGQKEAMSLKEFQHPHIVKFFRYWEGPLLRQTPIGTTRDTSQGTPGSNSGQCFGGPETSHILMEVLPMDLSQHLRNMANFTVGTKRKPEQTRGSPLSEDVALDVMLQLVKAMWHLNSEDIAHRDLKPNNVLVRPVSDDEVPEMNYRGYMRAKLADFGLAKTKAWSWALRQQSENVGTRIYDAPEVFNKDIISEKKYPRKADVWSFGIMFYEVLTGKPPFPGVEDGTMGHAELHDRIVNQGLRPKLPENCPDYLRFIIESCWQLFPEDRPSFADLLRMMRLAQVQSLGIIEKDHDLFAYKSRTGVKSLRPLEKIPALVPKKVKVSGTSIWGIMIRWISFNLARR